MLVTGAQAIVEGFKQHGVEVVFGIPGGPIIALFDALHQSPGIQLVLAGHEQGAAHAADGYARASGKVGVCLATSGPGATNLVTGIANAHMDSIPLVAVTGNVNTSAIGTDAFQEADITGITLPVVKHSYLVKDAHDLPQVVAEAFHIASTGRPGPVLIDVPKDLAMAKIRYQPVGEVSLASYRPTYDGHPRAVRSAAQAVNKAKRPVIYAGGGVIASGASDLLLQFAEKIKAPVTTTLMGKGCFPESHPLALHMLGMHGSAYANWAVAQADLLLTLGARFDDRCTGDPTRFASHATIVHVDIDPAEIGKAIEPHIKIVGDVRRVLEALLPLVHPCDSDAWLAQVQEWKQSHPFSYQPNGDAVMPQFVVEQICQITNGDATVVTDVGQHQMWAAQYYRCNRPRQFISSGGLGTMGFGLPAAIGAQLARPEATVFLVSGDGSFQMTVQELATAVREGLPLKVAIINNRYLGMVRQWQQMFFEGRTATSALSNPDFAKLADAFGAVGLRVEKPEDVKPALQQALDVKGRPVVIDFKVRETENVFPMIPAGQSVDKMRLRE